MPRVLIIDDDTSLLDVLALAFEDATHEVLTAADGAEGLSKVEAQRPDAIVSDVNMPGIDGFSLCRRLREAGIEVLELDASELCRGRGGSRCMTQPVLRDSVA